MHIVIKKVAMICDTFAAHVYVHSVKEVIYNVVDKFAVNNNMYIAFIYI